MNEASKIINKLMEYYNLHTISELAQAIKIGQPAISKWKNNNSINAIKKKCRELGIYDKIFDNYEPPEPFPPYPLEYFDDDFINANPYASHQEALSKRAKEQYLISEISEMDKTIVSSFINVYQKLKKEGNLIKLYEALGKLNPDYGIEKL